MKRARVLWGLALLLLVVSCLPFASAQATEVVVSSTAVGKTPSVIGYNSGHLLSGSNTAAWWKYSGVNGGRLFTSSGTIEGADDDNVWGDGVGTEQQLLDRRAALRADPLNQSFINWPHFENNYQNTVTTGNILTYENAYNSLHELNISTLAMIGRTNNSYPWNPAGTVAGWGDRWEHWQHFYAQAFYLARNFDTRRFQVYNEPDHSSQNVSQEEYLERLQFASDAIQAAVADVNTMFGKSLVAEVQAPVSAGGSGKFTPTPGGDPRDDVTGWGELVVQNLHTNFLGNVDPQFNLIHTYAYQQYNKTGPGFGSELTTIKNLVQAAAPGENLKFALTEFNVHTASTFSGLTETLDSPSKFSRLGSILTNLATQQPDELYVFKFSQTANFGAQVKKNGVHFVDNDDAPYNIGGITKGGEVVRLFTKGFVGARDLLAAPLASGTGAGDLQLAAAWDAQTQNYWLLSTNVGTSARQVELDLNAWGIATGTPVTIEEVSTEKHGEVRSLLQFPATGILTLNQLAESVLLVRAPKLAPAYTVTLDATDDALVKAGVNSATNYGLSQNLWVKNDPTNAGARNASFIKFDLGDVQPAGVEQAILRVHGENLGSDPNALGHVYAIFDDQWDETTITWNTAPNLGDGSGAMDDISHNFVEGIGESVWFVGHLTGSQTPGEIMLDVTSFVQEHPDQALTFLVVREVRFDGENVDDSLTHLQLASKERGTSPGPELLLSLNQEALPGDFDFDGGVDGGDRQVWETAFGIGAEGDADSDGDSDGADFLLWQRQFGKTIPINSPLSAATELPEPATLFLFFFAAAIGLFSDRQIR